ncbi:Prodigiosin synthesizing transferase PigC (Prodigiosin synthetase PigC) [Durusdinium trenchii]|uniref:Prodigiosin synthesizing transferase PigC (Prodigiosin synthetase PigC) n=1 Tax=Durusdinium trenchii TaxID=1381693 RepID=A0ABP0JTU2_9DINO
MGAVLSSLKARVVGPASPEKTAGNVKSSKDLEAWAAEGAAPLAFPVTGDTALYKTDEVGGKTLSIVKLVKIGVNVPDSMAVSVECYHRVVEKLQQEKGESVADWVAGKGSVDGIRDALQNGSGNLVSPEVREVVRAFAKGDKTYAVRSSANVEDSTDSSFAGQFVTLLNVAGTEDAICKAIEECWASCLGEGVRAYLEKSGVTPQMGVLVMEQIDSEVSGVLFQANPLTQSRSSWVINATYGQGEGVVGGTLVVDEFTLHAQTKKVLRKSIEKKTSKLVLNTEEGGLREEEITDEAAQTQSCMSDAMIAQLVNAAEKLRLGYNSEQDIEFAFVGDKVFILQARPITTMLETLPWEAPEVGFWQLNGHLTTPLSPIYARIWQYGMSKGAIANSDDVGLGFTAVDTAIINGFAYFCFRQPGPKKPPSALPPPFVLRMIMRLTAGKATKAATAWWTSKGYLAFMDKWDAEIKPALIARHLEMQRKDLGAMSDAELSTHLEALLEYGKDQYYLHSKYSMENLNPVGYFVMESLALSNDKITKAEAFQCLLGTSKISEGLHGEFPDTIDAIAADDLVSKVLADDTIDAEAALAEISNVLQGEAKAQFDQMMEHVKFRLAEGYDVACSTLGENPALLLQGIKSAVASRKRETDPGAMERVQAERSKHIQDVRSRIPAESQAKFDELLKEATSVSRLRDERAVYTDLWGMGVVRAGLLEAGRRITAKSTICSDASLIVEADMPEVLDMLKPGWVETAEFWNDLKQRRQYRSTASIRNCPPYLGGVKLVPTRAHFPNEYLARSALATIFCIDEIFTIPDLESEDTDADAAAGVETSLDKDTLRGVPGSSGMYTGPVCIVKSSADLAKIKQGDVVFTTYSSSLVNFILPVCGALVTDFGATLSHAAICAREAKIACVVGSKCGTVKFNDGDIVTVDGTKGLVKRQSAAPAAAH